MNPATTEAVKIAWQGWRRTQQTPAEADADFEAWLAGVKADALRGAADHIDLRMAYVPEHDADAFRAESAAAAWLRIEAAIIEQEGANR